MTPSVAGCECRSLWSARTGWRPVVKHLRTAKWTAITDRLAGTHRHVCALNLQAVATDVPADGCLTCEDHNLSRRGVLLLSAGLIAR